MGERERSVTAATPAGVEVENPAFLVQVKVVSVPMFSDKTVCMLSETAYSEGQVSQFVPTACSQLRYKQHLNLQCGLRVLHCKCKRWTVVEG